jgi:predicted nucleic acid-binding protein
VIVLDANVLIGFLDATDSHHAASKDLLERRFADGFGASVLTVAEALVQRQDAALASLVTIGVRLIPLEAADATGLARVRNTYRIRMPDAVAFYTALSHGFELATFDDSLIEAANRAGITVAK